MLKLPDNKKEFIKILKKESYIVFKVIKEEFVAIPKDMFSHYSNYNDFLKLVKRKPDKVFGNFRVLHTLPEFKKIKEV